MLDDSIIDDHYIYHLVEQTPCKRGTILAYHIFCCHSCRSFAAVGVDPAVMGVGPAVAIPAAVKSAGLEISDIDLFEINEVIVQHSNFLQHFGKCFGL